MLIPKTTYVGMVFVLLLVAAMSSPLITGNPGASEGTGEPIKPESGAAPSGVKSTGASKKKVLLVNSYHSGYPWSDGIEAGVRNVFNTKVDKNGSLDNSQSQVELRVIRMDTKRNPSEDYMKQAALKAKALIESWKPDVVIASDDNASKYLIVPYFRDTSTPFVFCGINWSAAEYGFPCTNVTGMIEVFLVPQLLEVMRKYAKGNRTGFIDADNTTSRKVAVNYKTRFGLDQKEYFVKTFSEWKSAYRSLQNEVDMIIMSNYAGISDWDDAAARKFVLENTAIPTGAVIDLMAPYSLVTFAMVSEEQGEWSAKTALEILSGKRPADIPLVTNKKARIFLNMGLAAKLGIVFPMDLVDQATFVE